mmetsp:Transcript_27549/g.77198  ORF Transcript_27549/g.77198 Transcript_27549/m.77198 type:complete len:258 (+) Transcript_27549:158-931(+)
MISAILTVSVMSITNSISNHSDNNEKQHQHQHQQHELNQSPHFAQHSDSNKLVLNDDVAPSSSFSHAIVEKQQRKYATSSPHLTDTSSDNDTTCSTTQRSSASSFSSSESAITTQSGNDVDDDATTTTPEQPEATPLQKKHVSFGTVQIRYYERIVGNHPEVRFGIPLGIGWSYDSIEEIDVDEYERTQFLKLGKTTPYKLSRQARRKIFHNQVGMTQEETAALEAKLDRKRSREERMIHKMWMRAKDTFRHRLLLH